MLAELTKRYLEDLARGGASAHTIDAYAADLREFLESLSPHGAPPPEPAAIDLLMLRQQAAERR